MLDNPGLELLAAHKGNDQHAPQKGALHVQHEQFNDEPAGHRHARFEAGHDHPRHDFRPILFPHFNDNLDRVSDPRHLPFLLVDVELSDLAGHGFRLDDVFLVLLEMAASHLADQDLPFESACLRVEGVADQHPEGLVLLADWHV